jgi:hypothetical protein
MPWGALGPQGLTAVATRYGVAGEALAPEILSPVHWDDARWILDPALGLEDVVAPATIAVHLYNEVIKGFKDQPAPPGSFLDRLQQESILHSR